MLQAKLTGRVRLYLELRRGAHNVSEWRCAGGGPIVLAKWVAEPGGDIAEEPLDAASVGDADALARAAAAHRLRHLHLRSAQKRKREAQVRRRAVRRRR